MDGQNEFASEVPEHQIYLEDQNHCCLCGSQLTFKHKIDYLSLKVTENADCPSCKICLKSRDHGLQ